MRNPGLQRLGDDLLFTFPGPDEAGREVTPVIKIGLTRLRESVSTGVHAEVTVEAPAGEIAWTNLKLDSERERGMLAKKLLDSWADFEWDQALRLVARQAVVIHRQGEPLVDLAGIAEVTEPADLINPLLPNGQVTLLYGHGAAGKSIFGLWLGMGLAYGIALPSLEVEGAGKTLYLDWETEWKTHWRRFQGLSKGFGITPSPGQILYRRMRRPVVEDVRILRRIIAEEGIKLIIADSVIGATGAELKESGGAGVCMGALRDLEVTVLAIHHMSKKDAYSNRSNGAFGSVYYENLARRAWEIRRSDEGYGGSIGLYQKKNNDDVRRKEPLGFAIRYEDGITVSASNVAQDASLTQYLRLSDQIATYMREQGNPVPSKELQEQFDTTAATLATTLRRDKRFTKLLAGRGRQGGTLWALADGGLANETQ